MEINQELLNENRVLRIKLWKLVRALFPKMGGEVKQAADIATEWAKLRHYLLDRGEPSDFERVICFGRLEKGKRDWFSCTYKHKKYVDYCGREIIDVKFHLKTPQLFKGMK